MSLPFLNTAPGYDEELRNSVFFERGLHPTSICGAVGAAVAVAMLQGQDEAGIASAAGIAASKGAGLLEANRTGGTVKRVHCGWAARCGVAAAELARHGLTGPPTVLEGREAKARPASGDHAAFSGPYTVAAALQRVVPARLPRRPARDHPQRARNSRPASRSTAAAPATPCPTRSWRGSSTTTP
jgi:2-methylcitrate dehydratase PrpD